MGLTNIRKRKAIAQDGLCYYCRCPTWECDAEEFARKYKMSARRTQFFKQTAEHLVARCDGGTDTDSNVVMACHYCNSSRHLSSRPKSPAAHKDHVQRRMKAGKWHGFKRPK